MPPMFRQEKLTFLCSSQNASLGGGEKGNNFTPFSLADSPQTNYTKPNRQCTLIQAHMVHLKRSMTISRAPKNFHCCR